MRAFRLWGLVLLAIGLLTLLLAWQEINEPLVSDLIIVGAILVGQVLPLPTTLEARIRRWGIALKLLVIFAGVGVATGVMLALNAVTGLKLEYAPPLTFLIVGLTLLAVGQSSWRRERTPASEA